MKYTIENCSKYRNEIHRLYYDERKSQTAIDSILQLPSGATNRMMKLFQFPARSDREQALRYTCNSHYFDCINTEEKAYWFGFLSADGYIMSARKHCGRKVGIAIMDGDTPHLEKFKSAIGYNGNIAHYVSKSSYATTPYCRIVIADEYLASVLCDKGCVEHKTGHLLFPAQDTVSMSLLRHYVRGYFDGNGSITHDSKNDTRIKMSGMIEPYAKEMLAYLGKPNLALEKRHKDRDADTYGFTIGGNRQVYGILSLLYDDCKVYLDRKYEKYLTFKREYEKNQVVLLGNK